VRPTQFTPAAPALGWAVAANFNNNHNAFWESISVDRGASRVRAYLGAGGDKMNTKLNECKLMNEYGKTIAMGSQDQMVRYLKHHVEDGMYAIEGPGIDMTYYRANGIVYPCGGTQDGVEMPPRSV
jgi:hypothetical protein